MSKTWMTMAGLALTLGLAGCGAGNDQEEAAEEYTDVFSDVADVLEGVTDEESLEAAKGELKDLGERMKELKDHYEALTKDLSDDELWDEAVSEELMDAQARMTTAMMKIGMNPALTQKFTEQMKEFGDAFDKN
ncbi:MAG: archaellum component FlaC [Pseudohongiellaceae bacterium]|jgi:archaellum component FlaC